MVDLNGKFSVPAAQPETAFVAAAGKDLQRIFSVQQERVVNQDNTVRVANRTLQIEKTKWRGTLAKCRVLVCEHLNGTWSVFYGPHLVGRYTADGLAGGDPGITLSKRGNPPPPPGFPLSTSTALEGSTETGQITC